MKGMQMKPFLFAASIVALSAYAQVAHAAQYTAVAETSTITFSATQQGSAFNGRFGEFTATIDFDPANPAAGKIVGVVKTESADTRDSQRDASLFERDWLDVERHPEARFESKSIEKTADGYRATGDLTLKGKTNPAVINFTFTQGTDSSAPAGAKFTGKLTIDRFKYDVGEGWNDPSYVGKDVDVELKLDLKKS